MPFVEQEESFKDEIIEGKTVKVYKLMILSLRNPAVDLNQVVAAVEIN